MVWPLESLGGVRPKQPPIQRRSLGEPVNDIEHLNTLVASAQPVQRISKRDYISREFAEAERDRLWPKMWQPRHRA